jgi:hypothetical protein
MGDRGYVLDIVSPVRHVATALSSEDGAPSGALSVADMAATYRHPNTADLSRVRQNENCATDSEAVTWLIQAAIVKLSNQVSGNGDGRYHLTKRFDELRLGQRKIHRTAATDGGDEKRALRAAYNDLREQRRFRVMVKGDRGGRSDKRFELHPLARAIPQMSEKEFLDTAEDIKTNGVELPIVVYNGQVLDGRHRLAIASTLGLPVRVTEVDGDDARARARVMSLNVTRRMLTSAQRALIVRQLFLPEAKENAKERQQLSGGDKTGQSGQRSSALTAPESIKATQEAVKESGQLANVRSVELLAPVDNAPKTLERIHRGEIETVAEGRREALKETGRNPEEKLPTLQPRKAWDALGQTLNFAKRAVEALEEDQRGDTTVEQILQRITEIRAHLDRAEELIGGDGDG